MNRFRIATLSACLLLLTSQSEAAPILHLVDFIPDGSRSNFNGFEAIPNDGTFYTGGAGPYTEDGISVQQVAGDGGNDIWVTYFTPEGSFGWYPNGGDNGYSVVRRAGGVDFDSVGLLRGSGFGDCACGLYFELWDNGVLIDSGTVPHSNNGGNGLYLGWSGGGFDEIRFRDSRDVTVDSLSGFGQNALAIDAIELAGDVTAPEPALSLLLGAGAAAFFTRRRRVHARRS